MWLFLCKKFRVHSEIDFKRNIFRRTNLAQKTDTLQQNEYLIEVSQDMLAEIKLANTETMLVIVLNVFENSTTMKSVDFLLGNSTFC